VEEIQPRRRSNNPRY